MAFQVKVNFSAECIADGTSSTIVLDLRSIPFVSASYSSLNQFDMSKNLPSDVTGVVADMPGGRISPAASLSGHLLTVVLPSAPPVGFDVLVQGGFLFQ